MLASLVLLVGSALPQTPSQPELKITVIIGHTISAAHDEIAVRFLNQSKRNLSFPRPWTTCTGIPGSITLAADAAPPTLKADPANLCGLEGRNVSKMPIVEQAKTWWLLHPGESLDVRVHILGERVHLFGTALNNFQRETQLIDTIQNPGVYKLRATYKAYSVTTEDREALLDAGYFLPSGDYESDAITFRVEP
jgi:hypothetical protein